MSSKIAGFAFEGSGKVERVDHFATKSGKDIVTLIVEVEGKYPQLVPIKCFGRLADMTMGMQGKTVSVTGKRGGREWNGKVYGDIIADTIEVIGAESKSAEKDEPPPPDDSDVPF
jgi:hypothetical protein